MATIVISAPLAATKTPVSTGRMSSREAARATRSMLAPSSLAGIFEPGLLARPRQLRKSSQGGRSRLDGRRSFSFSETSIVTATSTSARRFRSRMAFASRSSTAARTSSRVGKPGPYADIPSAIEGLKSPNLATQFLARERLLTEGMKSVPALTELLKSDEPNFCAFALWLLDRIGGDARKAVVEQLQDGDSAFRALAVRILRRHGEEYADKILAQSSDPSEEVRRDNLLPLYAFARISVSGLR